MNSRIFFSAGDPSGDTHTATLIAEIRRKNPRAECFGLGGDAMARAGCDIVYPLDRHAIVGIFEAVRSVPFFSSLLKRVGQELERRRPDVVVLVDYPGFNWWVARAARRRGIPVLYFLPPQIWAWATWRVRKMRRLVDCVLCSFPFEEPWYRAHGVRAVFTGHPYFDSLRNMPPPASDLRGLRTSGRVLTLLPGSRDREVERNGPVFAEAAARLKRRFPDLQFLAACRSETHARAFGRMLAKEGVKANLVVNMTPQAIAVSDLCLAKSGSVTLELLWYGCPAVIFYRVPRVEYAIYRVADACGMVKVQFISLPNIASGQPVLPEFVTWANRADLLVDRLAEWLERPGLLAATRRKLETIRATFDRPGVLGRAADLILGFRPEYEHAGRVAA